MRRPSPWFSSSWSSCFPRWPGRSRRRCPPSARTRTPSSSAGSNGTGNRSASSARTRGSGSRGSATWAAVAASTPRRSAGRGSPGVRRCGFEGSGGTRTARSTGNRSWRRPGPATSCSRRRATLACRGIGRISTISSTPSSHVDSGMTPRSRSRAASPWGASRGRRWRCSSTSHPGTRRVPLPSRAWDANHEVQVAGLCLRPGARCSARRRARAARVGVGLAQPHVTKTPVVNR